MKKPNFFIVGAPKCGTTSLAAWLAEHPAVFMSEPKELQFFSSDIRIAHRDDLDHYEAFFRRTSDKHLAVGEASTCYLRSRVAVPAILRYSPSARFIVSLRNPIDMAVSWHGQTVFEARETERDFAKAWALQSERRSGRSIPPHCHEPSSLFYGEVCKLGEQTERLLAHVVPEQVLIVTVDELRADPRNVYLRILRFLNIPDDGRMQFPTLNAARTVPPWLSILTRHVSDAKRRLGIQAGLGLVKGLNRWLSRREKYKV